MSEETTEPLGDLLARRVPVVYYVLFGNRIKIGTSRNLPRRLEDLTYERLLAIEPGSHAVEHMRHLEFRDNRVLGEWFVDNPQLRAHIATLVAQHGPPQAAYIQWLTDAKPA